MRRKSFYSKPNWGNIGTSVYYRLRREVKKSRSEFEGKLSASDFIPAML